MTPQTEYLHSITRDNAAKNTDPLRSA